MKLPSLPKRPRYAEFVEIAKRYPLIEDRQMCIETFMAHGLIPEDHDGWRVFPDINEDHDAAMCSIYAAVDSVKAANIIVREHLATMGYHPKYFCWQSSKSHPRCYEASKVWFGEHTDRLFDLGVFIFPNENDHDNYMPHQRFWLRILE